MRWRRVLRPLGRDLRATLDDDLHTLGLPPIATDPLAVVGDDDIGHLPDVAQRYLRYMGVVGRPRDRWFRAHLTGRFRMRASQSFMPCEVWQFDCVDPIARVFHMRIDMAGFVPMTARDAYVAGRGSMDGRLVGCVRVARGRGEEFDIGELTTWLNDAVLLAPSLLLQAPVEWTVTDEHGFGLVLHDHGRSVSATVDLDEHGAPVDFHTLDRFADLPDGRVRAPWSTPTSGWHSVDGRALPGQGAAVWHLPDGELRYADFEFHHDKFDWSGDATPA